MCSKVCRNMGTSVAALVASPLLDDSNGGFSTGASVLHLVAGSRMGSGNGGPVVQGA